jgi:lipopolysaccharide export LptBFGC system permease protein LptF
MNINNEIDKLLKEIDKLESYTELSEDDFYDDNVDDKIAYEKFNNYKTTIHEAKNEKVISGSLTFDRKIKLTSFGKEIVKNGGWLKYIEEKSFNKSREREKDEYDFKTKKWLYKTRFLPFIISGFALLVSILGFISNRSEKIKNIELKEEIIKLRNEINHQDIQIKIIQNNQKNKI